VWLIYVCLVDYQDVTKNIRHLLKVLVTVGGLNAFWILPAMLTQTTLVKPTLQVGGWLDYLSIADFPKTLSLLSPGWPENIFGKTFLMKPEFLILPLLAFSSLWFIGEIKNLRIRKTVMFFALISLRVVFWPRVSSCLLGVSIAGCSPWFPG